MLFTWRCVCALISKIGTNNEPKNTHTFHLSIIIYNLYLYTEIWNNNNKKATKNNDSLIQFSCCVQIWALPNDLSVLYLIVCCMEKSVGICQQRHFITHKLKCSFSNSVVFNYSGWFRFSACAHYHLHNNHAKYYTFKLLEIIFFLFHLFSENCIQIHNVIELFSVALDR